MTPLARSCAVSVPASRLSSDRSDAAAYSSWAARGTAIGLRRGDTNREGCIAMIVATTPYLAGHRVVETKGQVYGLVVRSRGLGGNIAAGLRSLAGGEIKEYTQLLEDTRRQAIDRMVENATLMGADAVISMRFDSSEMGNTMTEIVAYGTAVTVQPETDRTTPQPTTE
jgi:uncharacterized protein YbjQ (UPF0145 family)